MRLIPTPLIDSLSHTSDRKSLISCLCRLLLDKSLVNLCFPGRIGLEKDIGELNKETWLADLEQVLMVSHNNATHFNYLFQLFVIHKVYRTQMKLHQWNRGESADCKCCRAPLLISYICYGTAPSWFATGIL